MTGTFGAVSINATNTGIDYTPTLGFVGLDVFDYGISDGNGGTDNATVSVAVPPVTDFLFKFGSQGPNPGQLDGPNSIAFDSSDNVYVTSQNKPEIQVFDRTGNFLFEFTPNCVSRVPSELCIEMVNMRST